jgi:hypothetical protein
VCDDVDADGLVTVGMVLVCVLEVDMFELCGVFVWEFADGGEDMFCVSVEGGEIGSQINEMLYQRGGRDVDVSKICVRHNCLLV